MPYTLHMKKTDAIKMLGETPAKAAKAMGYKTVQAVYMWPDDLPQSIADKVNGAVLRAKTEKRSKKADK
jgi:hypothetical protein